MWGNTVAIHSVFKKKTTKLNSQPAQYEKKNRQRQFWKKTKKIIKNNKKTMWRNTVVIHNVLKKKTTKLNFQPAPY
jgi:hypothetical protein